jgi:hypothetical protein
MMKREDRRDRVLVAAAGPAEYIEHFAGIKHDRRAH